MVVLSNDYHALQLKAIYKSMDIFVGTRLHSTIFAVSENVPAICVTYHGTKALGVFKTLGLQEFVMTEYDSVSLNQKIDRLVSQRKDIRDGIPHILKQRKLELMKILKAIMPLRNVV